MQSFLQLVAHDLYAKIGNDLSRTVLIFPNKRANLFYRKPVIRFDWFVNSTKYSRKKQKVRRH